MESQRQFSPQDLSEASSLMTDISQYTGNILPLVKSLLQQIEEMDCESSKGISLLNLKCHTFLDYLINLTYIILRKLCGKKIEGNPAIERLAEQRTVLEKMRPIEHRLRYHIQKLLTAAATGTINADDPLHFRANPDNLVNQDAGEESAEEEQKDGIEVTEKKSAKSNIYVPPKISAAYYDGDETPEMKKQRLLERLRKKALSSSIMQELKAEYDMGPDEIQDVADLRRRKINEELKERTRYEEEYMLRLPLTKKQRHDAKQLTTMSTLNSVTRFDDISALDLEPDDFSVQRPRKHSKKMSTKKGKTKGKGFKRKRH